MFIDILIVSLSTTVQLEISNKTHLSTSKVFRSNCLFVNFKPQTNTADKRVLLL